MHSVYDTCFSRPTREKEKKKRIEQHFKLCTEAFIQGLPDKHEQPIHFSGTSQNSPSPENSLALRGVRVSHVDGTETSSQLWVGHQVGLCSRLLVIDSSACFPLQRAYRWFLFFVVVVFFFFLVQDSSSEHPSSYARVFFCSRFWNRPGIAVLSIMYSFKKRERERDCLAHRCICIYAHIRIHTYVRTSVLFDFRCIPAMGRCIESGASGNRRVCARIAAAFSMAHSPLRPPLSILCFRMPENECGAAVCRRHLSLAAAF